MKKGVLLHSEKPFIHVLSSNLRQERCDNCYSAGELLKCSSCSYVKYCDRKCQKSAWKDHKYECPNLCKLPNQREIPNSARLLARVIYKLKRGGDQEKGHYDKNKFRLFKDLMSHYSDIKNNTKRMEHSTVLYEVLKDFMGENELPNFSEFVGIYGRIVVNSFNILNGEMVNLGTGIYLGASTIDHSCEPNAVAVFSGTTILIRAIKDIDDFKWSKVRICYIDVLKKTEDRRSELFSQYFFLCDCARCNSITDHNHLENSLQCRNCTSPISCEQEEIKCEMCGWNVPDEIISRYKEIEKFTVSQHEVMNNIAYLDACKMCLSKQKGVFHFYNIMYVKTLDLAFEASIQLQKWDDALIYGQKIIAGYRKYLGDVHPLLGLHYMKFAKILLLRNENKKAHNMLEEAQAIILITHGKDHKLYSYELERLLLEAKSALYT